MGYPKSTLEEAALKTSDPLTDAAVGVISQLSDLADKGARVFLFTLGGFMVIFGLASKVETDLANFTPAEFIAVIALGAVLIGLGTLVTVYEFKTIHEEARHIRELAKGPVEEGQKQMGTKAPGGNM